MKKYVPDITRIFSDASLHSLFYLTIAYVNYIISIKLFCKYVAEAVYTEIQQIY